MVSVPSAAPSSTALMSKLWLVTPASNVSVPDAGVKSVTGVAVPPVADQPTVTGPDQIRPGPCDGDTHGAAGIAGGALDHGRRR